MQKCFFALTFDADESKLILNFAKQKFAKQALIWTLLDNIHLTLVYCYSLNMGIKKGCKVDLPLILNITSLQSLDNRVFFHCSNNKKLINIQKQLIKSLPNDSQYDESLFYPHISVATNTNYDVSFDCDITITAKKLKLYGARATQQDLYPIIKDY